MNEQILFTLDRPFRPAEQNQTYFFPIMVPARCEKLTIDFSYDPKQLADGEVFRNMLAACLSKYMPPPYSQELEGLPVEKIPLVNLLTVSLDASDRRYIGCAPRHPPRQRHEISAGSASRGFRPTEIQEGTWRLGLQCHAIVTDPVQVNICVKGVFQ